MVKSPVFGSSKPRFLSQRGAGVRWSSAPLAPFATGCACRRGRGLSDERRRGRGPWQFKQPKMKVSCGIHGDFMWWFIVILWGSSNKISCFFGFQVDLGDWLGFHVIFDHQLNGDFIGTWWDSEGILMGLNGISWRNGDFFLVFIGIGIYESSLGGEVLNPAGLVNGVEYEQGWDFHQAPGY